MRWRAVLLGMVIIATPGLPVAMLSEVPEPAPRAWPKSPQDELPGPPPRWDQPAIESLAMLRRVSASEARRSVAALAACEARAGRASGARRNARFRACATAPLARTDGFAGANSRMLSVLAGNSGTDRDVRRPRAGVVRHGELALDVGPHDAARRPRRPVGGADGDVAWDSRARGRGAPARTRSRLERHLPGAAARAAGKRLACIHR